MSNEADTPRALLIGGARIDLKNVRIREDLLLDELFLEGGEIRVEAPAGETEARLTTGETQVRAVMSEANLNRLVAASLPADTSIRNLQIALLSGRARISGKAVVTVVPIPFSVEATPRVENGVRITLDCSAATFGIGLPRAVVDVIQQKLNELLSLDVADVPFPIWIDDIRCEPGRLSAAGRARIAWPPQSAIAAAYTEPRRPASSGFIVSADPLFADPTPRFPALTAAPTHGESASTRS